MVSYQIIKNRVSHVFSIFIIILTVLCTKYSNAQSGIEKIEFTGYAYSLSDSTLLYSEHHSIISNGNNQRLTSRVQYKTYDGVLIADKTLKYDEQGYFPSINFTDLRTNQVLKVDSDEAIITIVQGDKTTPEAASVSTVKKGVMIADAGFDVFMMKNWESLVAGEPKVVDFLAPTRNMFVAFEIKQTFINESVIGFSLAPDNFFISLLVDPIALEYDLGSGRILSYKGLTNIEQVEDGKPTGGNVLAHIKYEYSDFKIGMSE
jgi:hypothetical protein